MNMKREWTEDELLFRKKLYESWPQIKSSFKENGAVVESEKKAKIQLIGDELLGDLVKYWNVFNFPIRMSQLLVEQMSKERGSGQRLDRSQKNKEKIQVEFLWKISVVALWSHGPIKSCIGYAHLTDETASAFIESWRDEVTEFTPKMYQDFRKKYGLKQVPVGHRCSGVVIDGKLKILKIGKKNIS